MSYRVEPLRVLFLSPVPLRPANDGVKIRGLALLDALEQIANVEVLHFSTPGSPEGLPLEKPPTIWQRIFSPKPSLIGFFASQRFQKAANEASNNADICFCLGLQMFQFTPTLPKRLPVVLDNFNVECDIVFGLARRRSGLKRLYWLFQAFKLLRYERSFLTKTSMALAISKSDRDRFLSLTGGRARVRVVPPGLDLQALASTRNSPVERNSLVFVGALDWHVNIEACRWMSLEVMPVLRQRCASATLRIVGRRPVAEVLMLGDLPGIEIHADVPEVAPYLAQASAVVVPLRFGSGVQTKVIEAMAAARPIVTTSVGLEGIDARPGVDIMVADDADSFAQKCLELFADAELADRIGRSGQAVALERYSRESLRENIKNLVTEILGPR